MSHKMPIENKRNFSRVESHIPLEVRLVPPEEHKYARSRAEKGDNVAINLPKDVEDPLLAEWLRFLNAKLDNIINQTQVKQDYAGPIYIAENISGGGISFTSAEEFSKGDMLEIKIVLSAALSRVLYLYGTVVNSEKRAQGYFTALQFISLDEALREEIIKFVFEKEREILREKRGE